MKTFILFKIISKLDEVLQKLKELSAQMSQDELNIIAAFDAATTAVGNRIAALVLTQTGLDPDFVTALNGEVTKLQALGTNATVPPPVPQATQTTT